MPAALTPEAEALEARPEAPRAARRPAEPGEPPPLAEPEELPPLAAPEELPPPEEPEAWEAAEGRALAGAVPRLPFAPLPRGPVPRAFRSFVQLTRSDVRAGLLRRPAAYIKLASPRPECVPVTPSRVAEPLPGPKATSVRPWEELPSPSVQGMPTCASSCRRRIRPAPLLRLAKGRVSLPSGRPAVALRMGRPSTRVVPALRLTRRSRRRPTTRCFAARWSVPARSGEFW